MVAQPEKEPMGLTPYWREPSLAATCTRRRLGMTIEPFVPNNSETLRPPTLPSGQDGRAPSFECLLEWVRLGSAHARRSGLCVTRHRENLRALVESEKRLSEFPGWRESPAFTEPEKAALTLSELLSLHEPGKLSPQLLLDAQRHFSTEEIVRLTLTIMAVNDWIDLHM